VAASTSVEIVTPWLGGCRHREAAWAWLSARYAERHPDWRVTLSPGAEPWVKALAVMPAIAGSDAEVMIVADADVWAEGLDDAIQAVEDGAAWAMPHRGVFRLTEASTRAYMAGAELEHLALEERAYLGWEGGGIVVARRETLLEIPMDPRFVGWGNEDESWAIALRALAGTPVRIKKPLAHLWHPPQPRIERKRGSIESWRLFLRYHRARLKDDPEPPLRELIKEAHAALELDQPTLHPHPPLGVG
jgi:hypothetical protein